MAVGVTVEGDEVVVRFRGMDAVWSLARTIRLHRDEITETRVARRAELVAELGWRVGGTYLPRVAAAGWYTWRGRRGLRQLWCVYRDPEVLVIGTSRRRPARLVLQTPDRHRLAALLAPPA